MTQIPALYFVGMLAVNVLFLSVGIYQIIVTRKEIKRIARERKGAALAEISSLKIKL